MIETIGSPWPAYAALLIVTCISRMRCGSWFAPAAFVGIVWSFFTGASLAIIDYPLPARGWWMLVVLIVAVQLGALIAHECHPRRNVAINSDRSNTNSSLVPPCRRYGAICTIVALFGCAYFLFISLEEFGLPFTPLGVLEVGARWTFLRYDDVVEPWSVRLLVMWFHPAALLGGILFASSRKTRDRIIAVITLLPAVVYGVLTGTRAAILLGLTCWIGGYIASQCVRNRETMTLFTSKRLALLLLTAIGTVGMFVSIDAVRGTTSTQSFVVDVHEQKLSNYMLAPPAAFADWYAHADVSSIEWGARTFAGEFGLLHLKTRIMGTYLEKANILGTESTNVYTIFRGLIEDFTAFGAALLGACIGGLTGWIYAAGLRNEHKTLLGLSAFYAVFLFSPIGSLFSFNGAALAWLVGWFVLTRSRPRSLVRTVPLLA